MLGDVLKDLRKKMGVTQESLAELLNIKRQTYSAYERNIASPDIPALIKMASYFGVTVGYLIEDEVAVANDKKPLSPAQKDLLAEVADLPNADIKKVQEYAELFQLKHNCMKENTR